MERHYELGTNTDAGKRFFLTETLLSMGILILGAIGSGKSRLMMQLILECIRHRRGVIVMEPGDLIQDLLGYLARQVFEGGKRWLLKKIHLVRLHPGQMARYQFCEPPDLSDVHPEVRSAYYESWQHTNAIHQIEVLQGHMEGESSLEGKPRILRTLTNVFMAATTRGRRLNPREMKALLNPLHPGHEAAWLKVADRMREDERAEFELLRSMKRIQDIRSENEGGLNRLGHYFGPLMSQMMSVSEDEPCFSLRQAMRNHDIVLVQLGKTPYVSDDQNVGLAKTICHNWMDALQECERHRRTGSVMVIDEAHKYVSKDLPDMQRVSRKYQGGLAVGTQGLSGFRKKDADYSDDVLATFQTRIVLRLSSPRDVQTMAAVLYGNSVDYTPLVHDVYQHQGEYEWLRMQEVSRSVTRQEQWGLGAGQGGTKTVTRGVKKERSRQQTWSDARTKQISSSTSDVDGWNEGENASSGDRVSPIVVDGQVLRNLKLDSSQQGTNRGASGSHAVQSGVTDGETHTKGGGMGDSEGITYGEAEATQESVTASIGGGAGAGLTVSEKLLPLPKIVHVEQETGQLMNGPPEQQLNRFGQRLTSHPQRHATVQIAEGKAFHIVAADVPDPYATPQTLVKVASALIRELQRTHDYFFTPAVEEVRAEQVGEPSAVEHAAEEAEASEYGY